MGYLYIPFLIIYHVLYPSFWRRESTEIVIWSHHYVWGDSAIAFQQEERTGGLGECWVSFKLVWVMSGSSVNILGAIPASRGVGFRKRILAEHFSNPQTVLTFKLIHLNALAAPEGALAAPKEAPPSCLNTSKPSGEL